MPMKSNLTILQAMSDPELLGRVFKRRLIRGDSWKVWRVFLASLFALPMDAEALEIYQKHTGRQTAPAEAFSQAWAVCGRRSGKSVIAAAVGTFLACCRDYSGLLAPGETGVVPIIAPDRRQCRTILGYINGFFDASPTLGALVKNRLKESIELTNGIRIEISTASFRTVRGYTCVGAVIDEAAFLRAEDSAAPDSELIAALLPAMSTIPGAVLLGISSPYARTGVLFEAYKQNYGRDASPTLVWKASSKEMNPVLNRAIIAAAYLRDGVAADSEYGANFRSDISSFISREVVESRVISGRFELLRETGFNYVAFTDPSGGSSDSFTLAVAHNEQGTAVLDCVREITAPFSPEDAVSEFSQVLKSYGIGTVIGDRYAGLWPRERFQKCGIEYKVAELTRSELYLSLLPILMSGKCELLDNKKLVSQLSSLERRTARSGKDSVDHSPGSHDDIANSVAGTLVQALGGAGVLGLVEYFKGVDAGIYPAEQQPARSDDPFGKQAARAFELKLMGAKLPGASEEITPCPRCQGPA